MKGRLTVLLRVLIWTWAVVVSPVLADPLQRPGEVIKGTTDRLVTALQLSREEIRRNPELARKLADDIVLPYVDFALIARRVLGRHWRGASREQRDRFTREFSEFLTNVYVTAMVKYADEIVSRSKDIRFPPDRWSPGDKHANVRMHVSLATGARAEVVYRMRWHRGGWKIHDVTILGVSFTLTYRTNFAREISQTGLDNLIDRLAARNQLNHRASRPLPDGLPEG